MKQDYQNLSLDVVFNPKATNWQLSYDGRKKEPIHLPVKFPLLLAQGAEGIAVGLSTKILPHNFNELIDGSVKYLKGRSFKLFPDFQTGGSIDVSNYNDGNRGGRVKVRATVEKYDKNTIVIKEIPYGTTTASLIESIIKASEKGKVKIKKITFLGKDNLLNFEFSIDSSISFELHTQMEIIKLKCEELVGQKVNKILFFHDLIENFNEDEFSDKTDKELQLKDVNYQNFNDIKDEKVREIFINIRKKIDSDA